MGLRSIFQLRSFAFDRTIDNINPSKPIRFLASSLAFGAFGIVSLSVNAAPPQFVLRDLGQIESVPSAYDFAQDQLFRINNAGLVAGTSGTHAVVFEEPAADGSYGVMKNLPPHSDASFTVSNASSVNEFGVIAGAVKTVGINKVTRAVIWKRAADGTWTIVPLSNTSTRSTDYESSAAWDINDHGVIVGSVTRNGKKYAAYWPSSVGAPVLVPGTSVVEPASGALAQTTGVVGEAYGVSNDGLVGGVFGTPGQAGSAFAWTINSATVKTFGGMKTLPDITPGVASGYNWGIAAVNNLNIAVGGAESIGTSNWTTWGVAHPYAWNSATNAMTDLFSPAVIGDNSYSFTTSWANDINDANFVVGSTTDGTQIAGRLPIVSYMSSPGVWAAFSLSELVAFPAGASSWNFYMATGVSNNGRIVGMGTVGEGASAVLHAFILTPVAANLQLTTTTTSSTPSTKAKATRLAKAISIEANTTSTLTLRARNYGPEAAPNTIVKTVFSSIVSFSANTNDCTTSNVDAKTVIECRFGNLGVDASKEISVQFQPVVAGELLAESTIGSDANDGLDFRNNIQANTFAVLAKASSPVDTAPIDSAQSSGGNSSTDGSQSGSPDGGGNSGDDAPAADRDVNANVSGAAAVGGCSVGRGDQRDGSLLIVLLLAVVVQLSRRYGRVYSVA